MLRSSSSSSIPEDQPSSNHRLEVNTDQSSDQKWNWKIWFHFLQGKFHHCIVAASLRCSLPPPPLMRRSIPSVKAGGRSWKIPMKKPCGYEAKRGSLLISSFVTSTRCCRSTAHVNTVSLLKLLNVLQGGKRQCRWKPTCPVIEINSLACTQSHTITF